MKWKPLVSSYYLDSIVVLAATESAVDGGIACHFFHIMMKYLTH